MAPFTGDVTMHGIARDTLGSVVNVLHYIQKVSMIYLIKIFKTKKEYLKNENITFISPNSSVTQTNQ